MDLIRDEGEILDRMKKARTDQDLPEDVSLSDLMAPETEAAQPSETPASPEDTQDDSSLSYFREPAPPPPEAEPEPEPPVAPFPKQMDQPDELEEPDPPAQPDLPPEVKDRRPIAFPQRDAMSRPATAPTPPPAPTPILSDAAIARAAEDVAAPAATPLRPSDPFQPPQPSRPSFAAAGQQQLRVPIAGVVAIAVVSFALGGILGQLIRRR